MEEKSDLDEQQPSAKKLKKHLTKIRKKPTSDEEAAKKRAKVEAKAMQPKEAIKQMRVVFDNRLKTFDKQGKIAAGFQAENAQVPIVDTETLPVENCVSWRRQDPNEKDLFKTEREFCVLIKAEQLAQIAVDVERLCQYATLIRSRLPQDSFLRFVVVGLEHFLRAKTTKTQVGGVKSAGGNLDRILFETSMRVNVKFHDEPDLESAGRHLYDCTKSIAEKLHKERKREFEDYLAFTASANLKPVKLDVDDQDTLKLCWRRMLQTMAAGKPNAEGAAKAIAEKYPTIRRLLTEYARLSSTNERELLLSNLIADDLAKIRVGPQISRAVFKALTVDDPKASI